jgi:hypothetical protein
MLTRAPLNSYTFHVGSEDEDGSPLKSEKTKGGGSEMLLYVAPQTRDGGAHTSPFYYCHVMMDSTPFGVALSCATRLV